MSTEKDEWIRRYLDGELNDEEERQALHHIAEDPELRSLLKFDLQLRQDLASDYRPESGHAAGSGKAEESLPEAFFDGVMQAIEQNEQRGAYGAPRQQPEAATPQADDVPAGVTTIWNRLWQPRQIIWRPVWSAGLAAAVLLLIISIPLAITTTQQTEPVDDIPVRQIVDQGAERVMMRFVYVDSDAESVSVAGDFSDWEPISLSRQSINGDVAWTGIIPLPRGEHRYMFIKNEEQWTTDPLANRFIDDGFGNKNAVISL